VQPRHFLAGGFYSDFRCGTTTLSLFVHTLHLPILWFAQSLICYFCLSHARCDCANVDAQTSAHATAQQAHLTPAVVSTPTSTSTSSQLSTLSLLTSHGRHIQPGSADPLRHHHLDHQHQQACRYLRCQTFQGLADILAHRLRAPLRRPQGPRRRQLGNLP
jgi:hypothetical protein